MLLLSAVSGPRNLPHGFGSRLITDIRSVVRLANASAIAEILASLAAGVAAPTTDLFPAIAILEADDVVLAEIAAGLHLDDVQRDFPDVFEPMEGIERNIRRLVLGQDQFLIAANHLGRSLHDNPMPRHRPEAGTGAPGQDHGTNTTIVSH